MKGDEILRKQKIELDRALKSVMPASWKGHARLAIHESEAVPKSVEQSAIEKANKIADKKGVAPERAANSLISKLAEKMEE